MRKEQTETVGFRLPAKEIKTLSEAAGRYGLSAGEYARRLVQEALEDKERREMRAQMAALQTEIRDLRDDLGTVLAAILLNTTDLSDAEVQAWVTQNLKLRGRG